MSVPESDREWVSLRLLATSDLHAHLLPHDYCTDSPDDRVGLSRVAALIRTARAQAANVLLFDNGDLLLGTPIGDAAPKGKSGPLHPMIAALNALGYDGATLGNHDFDLGIDFAADAYGGARFPVVVSNLRMLDESRSSPFRRSALIERSCIASSGRTVTVRIGIVGLVPGMTALWDFRHFAGRAEITDMVVTCRDAAAELREQGADIVIALAHTGIGTRSGGNACEDAAAALALTGGADALILGHTHDVFPNHGELRWPDADPDTGTVGRVPAVMPGFHGSHLGVIDLRLAPNDKGWRRSGHRAEARPIVENGGSGRAARTVRDDPVVARLAAPVHAEALRRGAERIGVSLVPLQTHFALVRECAAVRLIAEAQRWFVAEALRQTPARDLPVLSAAAPFRTGGRGGAANFTDIPAGDLLARHVDDLYPFPNAICALVVTGAELRDWLDRSASLFNRIEPGEPRQLLFGTRAQGYLFDVIDGLTYAIDLSRPARDPLIDPPEASRIRDLSYRGRPVQPTERFIVATNSHRVAAPEFGPERRTRLVVNGPELTPDVLKRYIEDCGTVSPDPQGTWRFVPMPGTSVIFPTGSAAIGRLGCPDAPDAVPAGFTDDGFRLFDLAL